MSEITQQGGVVIGVKKEGNKERIYFVGEDSHLLCIGATRSGKSRNLVVQSIVPLDLQGNPL
jgi:type IV secretion system protein VirD4